MMVLLISFTSLFVLPFKKETYLDNFRSFLILLHKTAPVVDSISPSTVSAKGGEVLLIHGRNFGGQNISDLPVVTLGSSSCKNITVLNPNYISCITPSLPSSDIAVEVAFGSQKSNSTVHFTPSGQSGTTTTQSPLPFWIWIVLAGGVVAAGVGGFVGGYFFFKKRSDGYALVTN